MTVNVAILGGSGFIGTRLCKRLLRREKVNVKVLDKVKSEAFPELWKKCDITKIESIRENLLPGDVVVNLAAEHKDNVTPKSLYYDVNVEGQKNLCNVMVEVGCTNHIFTSSVAVYGFVEVETDENGDINPFNDYGKSKYQAEQVIKGWFGDGQGKVSTVIRPTVVFGEANRGNVYNLLRQIASGKFVMIGSGNNKKSMAYVENVAAFIEYQIFNGKGMEVFNYVDKPDFTMNELVGAVYDILGARKKIVRVPYFVGYLAGVCFDFLSFISRKKFTVSCVRVKKFCASTQFCSKSNYNTFEAPVNMLDALSKTIENEFKS